MSNASGARLTVDLGNSRCKFRLWARESPQILESLELELDDRFSDSAERWLSELNKTNEVKAATLCAVADLDLERELGAQLARHFGEAFVAEPDFGLELDCSHPETIGRDRLFAARGALEQAERSTIVVDCGTALTVDLVLCAGPMGERRGCFAGGAIAPGPKLLADALRRGGARLPGVEATPAAPALGKHTRAALEAGIAVGVRGAARELVRGLAETRPADSLPVVLTGGAREFLTVGEPLGEELIIVPDLVHLGLLAALEDRGESR